MTISHRNFHKIFSSLYFITYEKNTYFYLVEKVKTFYLDTKKCFYTYKMQHLLIQVYIKVVVSVTNT